MPGPGKNFILRTLLLAVVLWTACGGGSQDVVTEACEIFVECGESQQVEACAAEFDNCAEAARPAYLDCLDECVSGFGVSSSCAEFSACEDSCFGASDC